MGGAGRWLRRVRTVIGNVGDLPVRGAGAGDHVLERVAHPPVEVAGGQCSVGDDPGRVAGAAVAQLGREVDAGDAGGGLHDLPHGDTRPGAEVVDRLQGAADSRARPAATCAAARSPTWT